MDALFALHEFPSGWCARDRQHFLFSLPYFCGNVGSHWLQLFLSENPTGSQVWDPWGGIGWVLTQVFHVLKLSRHPDLGEGESQRLRCLKWCRVNEACGYVPGHSSEQHWSQKNTLKKQKPRAENTWVTTAYFIVFETKGLEHIHPIYSFQTFSLKTSCHENSVKISVKTQSLRQIRASPWFHIVTWLK